MGKIIPKFQGRVIDKNIVVNSPSSFKKYLEKYEGKDITIIVKRYSKNRSIRQNNLYWLWLTHIGNEIGEDIEDLHSTFKAMFLVDRTRKIPIVKSTSSLSKNEMSEYMDKVQRRVGVIGITLPDPEEWIN